MVLEGLLFLEFYLVAADLVLLGEEEGGLRGVGEVDVGGGGGGDEGLGGGGGEREEPK